MRKIIKTPEYDDFKQKLEPNVIEKIDYLIEILATQPVINTKVAKKLTNTDFYEIRVQVNNEYRILTVTLDHDNINQCNNILFVHGFLKKSTKDYDKEIKKATKILEKWIEQNSTGAK